MTWIPTSEDELKAGLEGGLLGERHTCDVKRQPPRPGKNRDLAVDMACLAIDGGILVYGVAEHDDGTISLTPFQIRGFAERIDNVARTLVDPPLFVRVETFASSEEGNGFAVVVVPPSPSAPHMADDSYRARGDKTNRIPSDSEVVLLHAARERRDAQIEVLLDKEVERDPIPGGEQAHLFIVAEPVAARSELFHELLPPGREQAWIRENILYECTAPLTGGWSPDLNDSTNVGRRADGWAFSNSYVTPERDLLEEADEGDILDVEIHENGGVRLYCSRASDSRNDSQRVIFEDLVGGLLVRVLLLLRAMANESRFIGSWDIGLTVTNARGAVSYRATQRFSGTTRGYSASTYRMVSRFTYEEIGQPTDYIVEKLFGRMNRALNGGVKLVRPLVEDV